MRSKIALHVTGYVLTALIAVLTNLAATLGLKREYWPVWLLLVLCIIAGGFLTIWEKRIEGGVNRDDIVDADRTHMLKRMEAEWITGYLYEASNEIRRIEPRVAYVPNAIHGPSGGARKLLTEVTTVLPAGTTIVDLFQQSGNELLILGEAGVGKTRQLLELAQDLISRAYGDKTLPIPIVLNLSSWSSERRPLKLWLIDQLYTQYDVSREIAQEWQEKHMLLPLLDGLDEVPEGYRAACVEAINAYRRAEGPAPIVVCCRTDYYMALNPKLRLGRAVEVLRLTREQVEMYLTQGGQQLAGVLAVLRGKPQLLDAVNTPLMLTILEGTIQQRNLVVQRVVASPEALQRLLFGSYVRAMLRRREPRGFTRAQMTHWLAWLARTLEERHQSLFYLERLQPTLLPPHIRQWYFATTALVLGVLGGTLVGLGANLNIGLLIGLSTAGALLLGGENSFAAPLTWSTSRRVRVGVLLGLSLAICIGLLWARDSNLSTFAAVAGPTVGSGAVGAAVFIVVHYLSRKLDERWNAGLSIGSGIGGSVAFAIGSIAMITTPSPAAIPEGVIVGAAFGIITGVTAAAIGAVLVHIGGTIKVVEAVHWSWRNAALATISAGGVIVAVLGLLGNWSLGAFWGVRAGILCGLVFGLTGVERQIKQSPDRPNQGIVQSARMSLWGVGVGLATWVMLTDFLHLRPETAALTALTARRIALIVGLAWVLRGGFVACFQHYLLRLMLCCLGCMPINYVHFLEEARDNIVLRRAGGGYLFMHELLRKYFAARARRAVRLRKSRLYRSSRSATA